MKNIGIIITVCVVSLIAGIGIGKEVEGYRQSSETAASGRICAVGLEDTETSKE